MFTENREAKISLPEGDRQSTRPPEPEVKLTPEKERELIERLENAPLLDDIQRTAILLVWAKERPATEAVLAGKPWTIGEEPRSELNVTDAEVTKRLIKDLGLVMAEKRSDLFYCEDENGRKQYRDSLSLHIATSQATADLAQLAEEQNDDSASGRLYGYPRSAVKDYLDPQKEMLSWVTLVSQVEDKDLPKAAFAIYAVSPDKMKAQLKTAKRWAEATKDKSPILYQRIIDQARFIREQNRK